MTRTPKPTLAAILKSLREAAGLTQAALAELSGLSAIAVKQIEQGLRTDPAWSTIRKLARGLGVGTDKFATDD